MITTKADPLLRNRLVALEDFSNQINIGFNSFPGKNEDLIQKWIEANHPQKPFTVTIQYGTVIGTSKDAQPIHAALIYVVNPTKSTGFLWWKKVQMHTLNEPDWTLFIKDAKPLSVADSLKLNSLLQ